MKHPPILFRVAATLAVTAVTIGMCTISMYSSAQAQPVAQNAPGGGQDTAPSGTIQVVDSYDWGKVKAGALETTIEVKNVGNGVLHITDVIRSCGCTTAPIDKNVLKPGETAKIAVTLTASHPGIVQKRLTINSDDPSNASAVVWLKADVLKPEVEFFEGGTYILLNDGDVGDQQTHTIRLRNNGDTPITVNIPELNEANVTVGFSMAGPTEVKPGEDMELILYLTPQEVGAAHGTLRLTTTSTEVPETIYYIYGTVRAKGDVATPSAASTAPGK